MAEYEDDYDDRDERDEERIIAEAKDRVRTPAIVMLVFAIISLIGVPMGAINFVTLPKMMEQQRDQIDKNPNMPADQKKQMKDFLTTYEDVVMKVLPFTLVFQLIVGILSVIGSVKMMRLTSRGWSMTAAILNIASIGHGCCCLTLPIGIWAMMVLSNPQVQAGFAAVGRLRAGGDGDLDRERDLR